MNPAFDFSFLKQRVSIEFYLESQNLIQYFRRKNHRLIGACPIHGGDNPSAFVVDCHRNLWHCFTGCQEGGDIVELVRRLEFLDYRQTARRLAHIAQLAHLNCFQGPRTIDEKPFRPYQKKLPLTPVHCFLQEKGIWPLTAAFFEVGTFHGEGMLHDCIALRLYDTKAKPLGYAGRRLNPNQGGKWIFPKRLPKSQLLYHYHHLYPEPPSYVVIVESPWSVLRFWQLAIPSVALFGISLSDAQARLLQDIPKIRVMLDGDSAGRNASLSLCSSLEGVPIWTPDGCDPDDLSDKQLSSLVKNSLSS